MKTSPKTGKIQLTEKQIALLVHNGNKAESWDKIRIEQPFNPENYHGNTFLGTVTLGVQNAAYVTKGSITLPAGIYHSVIRNTSIGSDCAIHYVSLLSGYVLGSNVLLFNIDEMTLSDHPVFGTGIASPQGERR